MALALRKSDKSLHSGMGPADCVPAEDWILDPAIPAGAELPYVVIDGDTIRAMTDEERTAAAPPESIADRHAREQREGVALANGWVMRWTATDQTRMGTAKDIADLLAMQSNTSPLVPFYEVNETEHWVSYADAYQILGDYMTKVLTEQSRQNAEALNG